MLHFASLLATSPTLGNRTSWAAPGWATSTLWQMALALFWQAGLAPRVGKG